MWLKSWVRFFEEKKWPQIVWWKTADHCSSDEGLATDQLVRGLCVEGKGSQGSRWRPMKGEEGREWQDDWTRAPLFWLLLGSIGEPCGIRGPLRVEVTRGTLRGKGDP